MSNTMDESTVAMFDLVNILSGKLLHISTGRTSVWFPMLEITPCKMSFPSTNVENAYSRSTAGPPVRVEPFGLDDGCTKDVNIKLYYLPPAVIITVIIYVHFRSSLLSKCPFASH